jgi:hypothetical protein
VSVEERAERQSVSMNEEEKTKEMSKQNESTDPLSQKMMV